MKTLEVFTLTFVVIVSSNVNNRFRWLEGVFQGLHLPILCINKNLTNGHYSFIRQRWKFFMISVAMTSSLMATK